MVLVLVSKLKLIEVEFLSTGVFHRSDRDFPVIAFGRERCPLSLRRLGWWAIVAYFSAEPAHPGLVLSPWLLLGGSVALSVSAV